jgi:hypothetical protein
MFGLIITTNSVASLYSKVDKVLQDTNKKQVEKDVTIQCLNSLMRSDMFSICEINKLCDLHNIKLSTERYNLYSAMHCKKYGDMTTDTKEYLMACILDDMRSIIIPNHITE